MQENRGRMMGLVILACVVAATLWRADDFASFIYFAIAHLIFIPIAYFFYMLWQLLANMIGDSFVQMFPPRTPFRDVTFDNIPMPEGCLEMEAQLEALGFERLGELLVPTPPHGETVMYYFVTDKKPVIAVLVEQNGLGIVQFMTMFRNRAKLFTFHPEGLNLVTPTFESRVVRRSVIGAWTFHLHQLEQFKQRHGIPIVHKDIQSVMRSMMQVEFADIAATWDYRFKRSLQAVVVLLLSLIIVVPAWWALYDAPIVEFKLLLQLGASVLVAFLLIMYWQYQVSKEYVDFQTPPEQ